MLKAKSIQVRRAWHPTPVFLPGQSMDRGGRWATVRGVTKNKTWLKRLSTHIKLTRNKLRRRPQEQRCGAWFENQIAFR